MDGGGGRAGCEEDVASDGGVRLDRKDRRRWLGHSPAWLLADRRGREVVVTADFRLVLARPTQPHRSLF